MTYQQQPTSEPYVTPQQPKNGMGVTALVLGVLGLLLSWIPLIGFVGFVLGVLAIVFGGIAVYRSHKRIATNPVVSYFGLGLGALAFVVSTVVFGALVMSSARYAQNAGEQLDVPSVENQNGSSEGKVVRLGFGEQHTWSGGETISVAKPAEHTPSEQFMRAPEGKRYVAVDVTIRNEGKTEYNVVQTTITAQHDGQAAKQSFMAGDPMPNVQLPPGGETTYTAVFEVGEQPGKLQISVQPNAFATDTVYFSGKF